MNIEVETLNLNTAALDSDPELASKLAACADYLAEQPDALPYHQPAWLIAVTHAYQHACFYLLAWHQQRLVGILPLVFIKPPLCAGQLTSLPFCDQAAIVCQTENKSAICQSLLAAAERLRSQLKARSLELRQAETTDPALLKEHKVRMLLALPDEPELLWQGFKAKLRSQIRKAEKNGLSFNLGRSQTELNQFYHVFSQNMKRLGSPVHSKAWFEQLTKAYQDKLAIGLVLYQGQVIAGGIILISRQAVCIPWASSLSQFNHLAPNMLLYWQLLKHSVELGCRQFDFGRSSYKQGTYNFKQQWGAQPIALDWRLYPEKSNSEKPSLAEQPDHLKPIQKRLKTAVKAKLKLMLIQIWQRLPLTLANNLGPKVRRFISL